MLKIVYYTIHKCQALFSQGLASPQITDSPYSQHHKQETLFFFMITTYGIMENFFKLYKRTLIEEIQKNI